MLPITTTVKVAAVKVVSQERELKLKITSTLKTGVKTYPFSRSS
jgi:hypothetical protein